MEILQDLDEGIFETWDLEAIFDTANKTDRTDVNTNILEQFTDKGWSGFRVLEKIFPKVVISLFFRKLNSLIPVIR